MQLHAVIKLVGCSEAQGSSLKVGCAAVPVPASVAESYVFIASPCTPQLRLIHRAGKSQHRRLNRLNPARHGENRNIYRKCSLLDPPPKNRVQNYTPCGRRCWDWIKLKWKKDDKTAAQTPGEGWFLFQVFFPTKLCLDVPCFLVEFCLFIYSDPNCKCPGFN